MAARGSGIGRSRKEAIYKTVVGTAVLAGVSILYLVGVPPLLNIASGVSARTVTLRGEDLVDAVFVSGINACENLYLEPGTLRVYVTDCRGNVHLIDGPRREDLKIVKSAKVGDDSASGIDEGPDGLLYVGACDRDRLGTGGGIFRVDKTLARAVKVTGDYPGLNGLAFDGRGNLYFAAGNANRWNQRGAVYKMKVYPDGSREAPGVFLAERGCAHGLCFARGAGLMYLVETFGGIFAFRPGNYEVATVLGKTRVFETFDDLCVARNGDYWIAGPGGGFIRRYDPRRKTLVAYELEGRGRASSCRIRVDDGEEVLYVTEVTKGPGPGAALRGKRGSRGLFVIPLRELLAAEGRRLDE